jgi:hypothetical protein
MNSNRQPGLSDATIGVEFDKAVKYTYSDLIPMLGLIRKITNNFLKISGHLIPPALLAVADFD